LKNEFFILIDQVLYEVLETLKLEIEQLQKEMIDFLIGL